MERRNNTRILKYCGQFENRQPKLWFKKLSAFLQPSVETQRQNLRPAACSYSVIYQWKPFSSAGLLNRRAARPDTGPWHQLYRAERGSSGICHFSFL